MKRFITPKVQAAIVLSAAVAKLIPEPYRQPVIRYCKKPGFAKTMIG
jgi:hypothetical protein